jgi:hypothetical protein
VAGAAESAERQNAGPKARAPPAISPVRRNERRVCPGASIRLTYKSTLSRGW